MPTLNANVNTKLKTQLITHSESQYRYHSAFNNPKNLMEESIFMFFVSKYVFYQHKNSSYYGCLSSL